MKKKIMNASEMGKKGNEAWMKKHGREKLVEMAKKSAKAKLKKDPNYFKHIRQVGLQARIKREVEEVEQAKTPRNAFNQFTDLLIGKN